MSAKQCAGCMNTIKFKEYLQCCLCRLYYDLLCANLPDKRFKSMCLENKNNWKCPECRNKQPKGDNTNTPVRPVRLDSPTEVSQRSPTAEPNVTFRKKNTISQEINKTQDELKLVLSQNELRNIIRSEVECVMKTVLEDHFKKTQELITDFQQSLSFFNEQYEIMKTRLDEKSAKLIHLEKENHTLQESVKQLSKRVNMIEQHGRSGNVELQCVPENRAENLVTIVTQLSQTINNKIRDSDILHCTRIAKKDTQSKRPRSILVKFNSPRARDNFLAAAIKYNKTNPKNKLNTSHLGIVTDTPEPVYVVEHLSADNKALHAGARIRAKELGYKSVWVRNGRIFMRKNDSTEGFIVKNLEMLKSLN